MLHKVFRTRWLALLLALSLLLVAGVVARPEKAAGRNQEMALVAPPFLQVAPAGGQEIGEMLDEEAGISAWYQASGTIDLDLVRDQFRTIELDTGTYIVGSVDVPNYAEEYDVHVYVHVDGWILAYYLNDDPVSKIVDVKASTLDTTHLKNVIAIVAGAAGYPVTDVSYYDFRYPNATNMLFVAEDLTNGNSFTIEIPSAYAYFERSWALGPLSYFIVDGVTNPNLIYWGDGSGFGTITAAQFLPDTPHAIAAAYYGVLVIVYRVP